MPFPFLAAIGSSIIGTIMAAGTAVGAAVATASASTLIIGGIAVIVAGQSRPKLTRQ